MKSSTIDAPSALKKAQILVDALPYMQQFRSKTIVIKYDGHAMVDENLKQQFAVDIVLLKQVGINPVIIHGGGPQATVLLERLGMMPSHVDGVQCSGASETMDIMEMVLVGNVNKQIVGSINHCGGKAVGLSGRDGDLVCAKPLKAGKSIEDSPHATSPELFNMGRVGTVSVINTSVLDTLIDGDFIPVIAPVGVGTDGRALHINADLVATAIAKKLKAEKLMLLADVLGVKDRSGSLLSTLSCRETAPLIEDGTISGGMLTKAQHCKDALQGGVNKTYILDGRVEHAVLLEILTPEGIGTEISL